MNKLSIINDLHIGALRSGGTTPASAFRLRQYLLESFRNLLARIYEGDVLILGDQFDTGRIPFTDLWATVQICKEFMEAHPVTKMYNVVGNHDLEKTLATMSSFQLFSKFMETLYPERYFPIFEPTLIPEHDLYVIGHRTNQDIFNLDIASVPKVKRLALHCNVSNVFAQQSDHSLNLSLAQAESLPVDHIIVGHEHQRTSHLAGKVLLPGNQIPSSISDCMGNADSAKYMTVLSDSGVELVPVWEAKGSFARVDWRELATVSPDAQFIRVQGDVTPAEAPAAVNAISKLRSTHNAFVITNAVQIEERDSKGEKITLEQIQGYDILKALLKRLTPEQGEVVKELLKEEEQ